MLVLTVLGARPQFVKAAPVSHALEAAGVEEILVHTGQHYDAAMSDVFFDELGLRQPDHHLGVGSASQAEQTAEMLRRLEPLMIGARPDVVVVYGDTNSTLAAALAAAKLAVPIAHVEAGLRSGRRDMPEEINRVVTDHLASLCFCPSPSAVATLAREGITEGVVQVGDVMLDALMEQLALVGDGRTVLHRFGLESQAYALATVHRAANTDDPNRLEEIVAGLGIVATEMPVVFAVHPRTAKMLDGRTLPEGVRAVPPQPYRDNLALLANARVALTDSGGLQKEAYWLGVPCVTLRDETEWPETLDGGWNVLAGSDSTEIGKAALRTRPAGDRPAVYGEPGASSRLVGALQEWQQAREPTVRRI